MVYSPQPLELLYGGMATWELVLCPQRVDTMTVISFLVSRGRFGEALCVSVRWKNKVSQFYSWHENLLQIISDKQPLLSRIFCHVFSRQSGLSDLMFGRCYFIKRQWKHCLVGQQGQKGEGLWLWRADADWILCYPDRCHIPRRAYFPDPPKLSPPATIFYFVSKRCLFYSTFDSPFGLAKSIYTWDFLK